MAKEKKEFNQVPLVSIVEVLDDAGVKFRENTTSQLIMDECYNCHRSKKLYVNRENGLYTCFYCNVSGNAVALLHHYLNISFKEASKKLFGKEAKQRASIKAVQEEEEDEVGGLVLSPTLLKNLRRRTKDLNLPEPLVLPPEFKTLTADYPRPWNYLLERGYTPEVIKQLKLFVLPQETFAEAWKAVEERLKKTGLTGEKLKNEVKAVVRYHERIIFPLYVENQVLGLVARDYTGTKDPKVLNSTGGFRSYAVWNFDNAVQSSELVICEGNSSAVKCGIHRSIALLGKVATPGQIKLIRKMAAKKLIICLDVGTEAEQKELYKSLANHYPGQIYQIKFPPVLPIKQSLSTEQVEKIRVVFGVDFQLVSPSLASLPYEDKEKMLRQAKVHPKMIKEKKMAVFSKYLQEIGFDAPMQEFLRWLLFKAEYKDAGDYTPEEMEAFIAQAVVVKGGYDLED